MERERSLEIATTNIKAHEDPNVRFSASPEFLEKLKRIVYKAEAGRLTPSHHIDAQGLKWDILGRTFPTDEINLPKEDRHYSFYLSRPANGGFTYRRIPMEALSDGEASRK